LQESTDGSSIEAKESALVWYYKDADPDFGSWQVSEETGHEVAKCKPARNNC
jgi:trehalose 6-phosphate synthase/phosphatase